jgi:hypothetical protein
MQMVRQRQINMRIQLFSQHDLGIFQYQIRCFQVSRFDFPQKIGEFLGF